MFLEYNGKIYVFDDHIDIETMWFVAKNDLDPNDPIVMIWQTYNTYKCTYSPEIMERIHELNKKIYVSHNGS